MKNDQVKVGNVYSAKITDKVVPVRIDAVNKNGGWDGTNLQSNRKVHIKSAQKLRGEVKGPKPKEDAATEPNRARKNLTAAERKELQAKLKADHENARPRDGREATNDGMAANDTKADSNKPEVKAGAKAKKDKKLSLIDAAAQVLAKSKVPMNTKQMVEQVVEEKLWSTTAATPHATLYSAILREMQSKGNEARFVKVDRGLFTIAKGA